MSFKSVSRGALALSLLAGMLQPAFAETYDFSYTFGSGDKVTGSFDAGGNDGVYVDTTTIANIGVSRNGVALDGPLLSNFYDLGSSTAAPVISFFFDKNAFIMSNCAALACGGPGDPPANYNFFLMRHSNLNQNAVLYKAGPGGFYTDDRFPNDSWSLVVRAPVPEPSAYALAIGGLAVLGLAFRRRSVKF